MAEKNESEMTKNASRIKWSILKNVFGLSFSFLLLFTSYHSLASLQSSLYKELGSRSLGMVFFGLLTSCLFLSTMALKMLSPKWVICWSMLLYCPYFTALFYPTYSTFFPLALLLGLGGGCLWTAQSTYLTKIAEKYGEVVGESYDVAVVRFFGIFFFFHLTTDVLGNVISSSILSVGISNFTRSNEFLETCGANYCPHVETNDHFANGSDDHQDKGISLRPEQDLPNSQTKIYVMISVYLSLAVAAVLYVALFIDPLSKFGIEIKKPSARKAIFATFRHMKKPYQTLIIPLTIWSGIEQGLLLADYTAAFVACGIGVHMVGYAVVGFGLTDAIFSIVFSILLKYVSRLSVFTFAALLSAALIIIMFTWMPDPNNLAIFFVIPTLWGMADAVWQSQIKAFYGVIFPSELEAAFSNQNLWNALGAALYYAISGSLCMRPKLYIASFFLLAGMVGYYAIEVMERKKNKCKLVS